MATTSKLSREAIWLIYRIRLIFCFFLLSFFRKEGGARALSGYSTVFTPFPQQNYAILKWVCTHLKIFIFLFNFHHLCVLWSYRLFRPLNGKISAFIFNSKVLNYRKSFQKYIPDFDIQNREANVLLSPSCDSITNKILEFKQVLNTGNTTPSGT